MENNVSVIGCGRWGAFLAWYLDRIGFEVSLYGRPNSPRFERLLKERGNGLIELGARIRLTDDLKHALKPDTVIISVNSQGLRALAEEIRRYEPVGKCFALCMKGLEIVSGKRLSQVVEETLPGNLTAVWIGPGHVQELYSGAPSCMVIDSGDAMIKRRLAQAFSSDLIRFYYGNDLIGNEVGAAAKNVIGVAAGMLDGLRLTSLKGALMSRGAREVSRLISALGGDGLSAYGLCHLGDYEATVFSPFSHNRKFGEAFVGNTPYNELAEGVYTVRALMKLARQYGVELPICEAVHNVLFQGKDARSELNGLFMRSLKKEF